MYFKKLLPASIAGAAMVASAAAIADIEITVNGASGGVGSTVIVTYDYSALDADDASAFQFDLLYDPAVLTPVDISQCGANRPASHGATCSEPGGAGNGTIRTLVADLFTSQEITPFNIVPFGQFEFQIEQPGTHTLTFTNPVGSDTAGGNVPMTGNNATITGAIVGDAGYSSTPASGATVAFGPAPVGSTLALGGAVTVSEIGDQQLDVTAFNITGANAGDFTVTTAPFSIADGGAPVGVDIECTPSSRGNLTANVEFANNSVNQPNANYDLTCAGESPNVAVSTTTINLTGVIGGTNPTGSFDITNADDGFTNAATNAALAESGTPEISITDGLTDATIQVDETDGVTVECDTTTSGMFSETITLTFDDPNEGSGTGTRTVTVNCDIANAVPSFAGSPAAPGPLSFGTVTNGTTSAPIGIDVSNDGVGPSPASDLNIASATVSDPQFAVTVNDSGPFVVGDPAVADAVEVTCTPDAGTTGSFTGTLTINHNGDDDPTTYNLECAGQTDATFSSTPPDGGNLNLGIVPPVTMTPPGDITFSNGGSADSYDVDCTVTDPDGVFTFSPDPISFTVAPGGSQAATFQCTPAAPQIYQADVACTITGADVASANYTVTCAGQPLVVPTMNRWGLILMALVLLALGGFAGRRMMA